MNHPALKNENIHNDKTSIETTYSGFKKFVIFFGRICLVVCILLEFIPPLYLYLAYGLIPDFAMVFKGLGTVAAAWFVLWFIEPISYFPLLGLSGTFISWVSGNIINLRVPCSSVAQQVAEVEEGTPQGDVCSTLGICISVIVNLAIVALFALVGNQVLGVMSPALKESFNYILPALMGAMLASYAFRNWKIAAIAVSLALVVYSIGVPTGFDLLLIIFPTLIISIMLHKKGWV